MHGNDAHRFCRGVLLLLGVASALLLPACARQPLSIEEAKQVTMSVQKATFVPPPRRAYDVIELLERSDSKDAYLAQELMAVVISEPPHDLNARQLAQFLLTRGKAARQMGLFVQAREDLRHAFYLARISNLELHDFQFRLGSSESVFGNYRRTEDLVARSARASGYVTRYAYMVKHYARMGDLESARQWRREGLQHISDVQQRSPQMRQNVWHTFARAEMEAMVLEMQGRFQEAEPLRRIMVQTFAAGSRGKMPSFLLYYKVGLINNLHSQGRLVEAEIEARQAITEAVAFGGKGTYYGALTAQTLGRILISQNRLSEAQTILEASITIAAQAGLPADTPLIGMTRLDLVDLLAMQGDYTAAARYFDQAQTAFAEPEFFLGKLLLRPTLFAALILAGRPGETMRLLDDAQRELAARVGETHPRLKVLGALRGMAQDAMGDYAAAAINFRRALPSLIDLNMQGGDKAKLRWLVRVILEAYLDHLATNRELSAETDRTAFRIAEALRHRDLQVAIRARSARVAIKDPALKELARRAQDSRQQIGVLEVNLSNLLSAPADQVDPALVASVSAQLEQLKQAHQTLASEIRKADPRHADYTDPPSVTLEDVQTLLQPDEAMLTIYTTRNNTLVWGIPHRGPPRMAVASGGEQAMAPLVDRIRRSLDARPATLGDIPAFDLAAAHRLYRRLLVPVSGTWSNARELLVVTGAPLDRIPLAVLPVSAPAPIFSADKLLFDSYRRVDWLISHTAVSRHASVAAFAALRRTPVRARSRQAFAGFGNPVFGPARRDAASSVAASAGNLHIRERGLALWVRGVRVTDGGSLDDETIQSIGLQDLVALPDTEEEIRDIARSLKADPAASVFVGKKASESLVKSMNLADRRVIAFATHALVPGDLDGLRQPALALSAPEMTAEKEDGLLTMGEIMTLKLDADWVVLSACNTGSGDGSGAEALSGLGVAFFYAGSRALLASLWPVETTSARLLTTGVFQRQQADSRLGRARALQQSILALVSHPGLRDPRTGRIAASYAHPLFWAPFILVGEGAAGTLPAP